MSDVTMHHRTEEFRMKTACSLKRRSVSYLFLVSITVVRKSDFENRDVKFWFKKCIKHTMDPKVKITINHIDIKHLS